MIDRHGVIWTRIGGRPIKMANLVVTSKENRISYTKEFLDSGLPGFSLLADPDTVQQNALIWTSTELRYFHPRLMAMVPPQSQGNFQRRIYSEMLARRPVPPAPGIETEWEMLLLSAKDGIGHLDVFEDDIKAAEWYRAADREPDPMLHGSRSKIWNSVRNEIRQISNGTDNMESLSGIFGGTPTAGGMISKILVAIPDPSKTDWHGEFVVHHGKRVAEQFVDVIIKIEDPQYTGLMDLEGLCLDVHREAGFEVPRHWRVNIDDMQLLAIERFDRTPSGAPIPFESLMSVFAAGSKRIQTSQDVLWTEVGENVAKLGQVSNLDVRATQQTLFRRLAYALMTGNGDMHLDNIGLLGGKRDLALSPVYDPAPMRAWSRHNMRMSIPIEFDHETSVYAQIAATATAFGMTEKQGREFLLDAAEKTKDYCERVMALKNVPEERRLSLVGQVQREREELENAWM